MTAGATYVYCIVSSPRPLRTTNTPAGPPGTGVARAIEIRPSRYLIVSDAPVSQYGETALAEKLSDLDWVSRAAVAHEAVTQSFMSADAVVPMKLFTLFTSDARALDEVRSGWARVEPLIKRLTRHDEWGVRLVFDETKAPATESGVDGASGRAYLLAKRQQHAAAAKLTAAMRKRAGDVIRVLRPLAREVEQRAVAVAPESRSRLLLDAAFLVPRAKAARFRSLARGFAKQIAHEGYALQLSGPWPPYSFVERR